jgi:hypothetical protein
LHYRVFWHQQFFCRSKYRKNSGYAKIREGFWPDGPSNNTDCVLIISDFTFPESKSGEQADTGSPTYSALAGLQERKRGPAIQTGLEYLFSPAL